ncbi:GNAT family N-acetyltransferase [Bradyrhizobium sp. U87765 SZCCT0131]|uniref:GNAT family N-acetyltransferase n=1 Tax=unclassified Bradyrhizobium TaxID=2631580 RepID=UPI001BA98BA8|nr:MULTISPECIES: GNAT family N-acetyltransferase [unclassified Bradyrhizobium]MBR1219218.1 GNAT family N-acetyltransferase [Bradyrhizobium sp. U87765 SZCCT0131]MBR1261869.1 GNAT family N-acetyltransferase [Bradyrhizobium sp. U87765 SZCCT0134]MBR1306278.1 GNAT family N-acetyltransferase [Bradyrhizobium sp. U87765 SZCCT0110]MBR1317651.1 GNAT family N-acetyltransferase [Bradyrhizobium sp. U87765 SZCCT0109]MBR1351353.1 GNAT family N-acetyltransferase [Bradyrhizobium sp. U87765 SZCCT0048]
MPTPPSPVIEVPPPPPLIRAARRKDIAALVAMISALAAHHGDASSIDEMRLERDAFCATPWIHFLVAEADGEVVGFAALRPFYSAPQGVRAMELHNLFVVPSWRGRAVGRALVEAALQHARGRGCRSFSVGTATDNAAARAFYCHLGFEAAPVPGPRFRVAVEPVPQKA